MRLLWQFQLVLWPSSGLLDADDLYSGMAVRVPLASALIMGVAAQLCA